jgi:hypothetical protein
MDQQDVRGQAVDLVQHVVIISLIVASSSTGPQGRRAEPANGSAPGRRAPE